jgi:hypothetical protein
LAARLATDRPLLAAILAFAAEPVLAAEHCLATIMVRAAIIVDRRGGHGQAGRKRKEPSARHQFRRRVMLEILTLGCVPNFFLAPPMSHMKRHARGGVPPLGYQPFFSPV